MDATTAYSAYGHRQDDFGYLSPESQAEIIEHAYAIASLMNYARDLEVVKEYTDGSTITVGDVWTEIRQTAGHAAQRGYVAQPPMLILGVNASTNMFA